MSRSSHSHAHSHSHPPFTSVIIAGVPGGARITAARRSRLPRFSRASPARRAASPSSSAARQLRQLLAALGVWARLAQIPVLAASARPTGLRLRGARRRAARLARAHLVIWLACRSGSPVVPAAWLPGLTACLGSPARLADSPTGPSARFARRALEERNTHASDRLARSKPAVPHSHPSDETSCAQRRDLSLSNLAPGTFPVPSNTADPKIDVGVRVAFQPRYHVFVKAEQKFSDAVDSGEPPCVHV